MNLVRFNYPEAQLMFKELLTSKAPAWIGRNGGSDTDFVERWDGQTFSHPSVDLIRRLNGYFDTSCSVENLHRFRDMYIESSKQMDLCTVHMSSFFGKALDGDPKATFELENKYGISNIMCWRFIENCTYFLESFQNWGVGKRILVVSPFSQSVKFQTLPDRIGSLHLPQYKFPECQFLTVNTPITYNTESWMCDTNIKGNDESWFDKADLIFSEIKNLEFDVAWLSCGSYAMYLGPKIKNELNKHAIYVGGMANVFFNLYNFRYSSTGHDRAVINPEFQIESFENEKFFTNDNVQKFPYSEGVRAYFGKMER